MKKLIYTFSLAAVMCGCENFDEVASLDNFDVIVTNITEKDPATGAYIVKRSQDIEFEFLGDRVDNIIFYSGDIGEEYRYRNRGVAEKEAMITPMIKVTSASLSLTDYVNTASFEFKTLFDDKIPKELNDESMAAITDWNTYELRSRYTTTGQKKIEYFNFTDGFEDNANANADFSEWRSHNEVLYAIRSKSNTASTNRLQIQGFDVSNKETRDYSYTYNDAEVAVKKTKEYVIYKDCSILDHNFKISSTLTAANWAMYTPKTTILKGGEEEVPNSWNYGWNLAEFGLKYGELTGSLPWVKTNKFGQNIRGGYAIEMAQPTQNIMDKDGNLVVDIDGEPISEPTEEMKNMPSDSWIVSGVHNIHQVDHDVATAYVKNKVQSNVKNFIYAYAKAGKGLYTATFHVNNQTHMETAEKVIEIKFMVVD